VWEDHLLPLLTCKEAARLGCTCKALRGVVREHFKDLGGIELVSLRAALTTFPRARSLTPYYYSHSMRWDFRHSDALVEWLRKGGRGAGITRIRTTPADDYGIANSTVHTALQGGALPSLKGVAADLVREHHRASMTGGFLGAMHELRLKIVFFQDLEYQLAALGLVRQLPALATLELVLYDNGGRDDIVQESRRVRWPAFIPPSLKTLRIVFEEGPPKRSLLRALPGMLGASGARLERLEVPVPSDFEYMGDGLVHVAQALRCCCPTLKRFRLSAHQKSIYVRRGSNDYYGQVKRLRVQWDDVMAGVSACRELEVLVLPPFDLIPREIEPLFPPGTAFDRLTHLEIFDHQRWHVSDAGAMGLWEVMASGGLPALAKLRLRIEDCIRRVGDLVTRVAPAFEAVAGTLTHLHLQDSMAAAWVPLPGVGYELGVAVGKLRRLKDLTLDLSQDGRAYHAVAQGLAAGGGERPLPLLWRVQVVPDIEADTELLTSLLLPSVRVFVVSSHMTGQRAALLMACALQQAGYKHIWASRLPSSNQDAVRAIAQCRVVERFVGSRWLPSDDA
jgi:hypothetical protein